MKRSSSIAVGSLLLIALSMVGFQLRAGGTRAATSVLFYSQSCQSDGRVQLRFSWTGNDPLVAQQWVDLSLFNNGWQPGTFLGSGPLPATASSLTWNGLIPSAAHFVRVNQLEPTGTWDPSATFYFQTLPCGASSMVPAPPSNLMVRGAIPDLSQQVPPGGGELGRITISWQDNSNNEDGFRVYQDCGGSISALFELEANTTS